MTLRVNLFLTNQPPRLSSKYLWVYQYKKKIILHPIPFSPSNFQQSLKDHSPMDGKLWILIYIPGRRGAVASKWEGGNVYISIFISIISISISISMLVVLHSERKELIYLYLCMYSVIKSSHWGWEQNSSYAAAFSLNQFDSRSPQATVGHARMLPVSALHMEWGQGP